VLKFNMHKVSRKQGAYIMPIRMRRLYSFWFHYRRSCDRLSVHHSGKCYDVKTVDCCVPCRTKRNNRQPRLVMHGKCFEVLINNDIATII
jgi:hypothetical protein